jgi:xylulokinase
MAVISIDLGTTGCKAAVFDGAALLGSAYRHYSYVSPEDGWAEQDAEAVWELVRQVVKEALASSALQSDVLALCLSVQGDAIIPIDVDGTALHAAILGMDTRSHREAADLQEHFGRGRLYAATGMPCEPLNAITKIFWLLRNRPELRQKLWKFVHYGEFLAMKIAGVPALDYSMASRTMAFDPVRKDWVPSILEFVGVTPSQLGNVTPSGAPVGIIRASVAAEWGISRNALVVSGGHDQCMAAIGAGVIEPGLACYSMGTAEVIGICFGAIPSNAAMLDFNYPCYCHAAPEQNFTISLNQSGGLSLEWFQGRVLKSGSVGALVEGVKLSPSPVLFLPHIVGSGTPACDHLSRGSFLGLSLKTGQAEMFQAVVDALAYEARVNLETLEDLGIAVTELRAVGGGAQSAKLLELKATVLQRPIRTLQCREAALLGAAMLAQVALRQFGDLEEARRECVKFDSTVEPRAEAMEAYSEGYERFRQVYGTLRSFYHHWRAECPSSVPA